MDESIWKPDSDFGQLHRPMIEDLTSEQLKPIVEQMAGSTVTAFDWAIDRPQEGKKGFYGYKLIPTFTWTRTDGSIGNQRCCLKQVKPLESIHYRYLERFQLPMCHMFGEIPLADGEEIVVLEYLEPIGHESLDESGQEWFLGVKATLNAVPVDDDYHAALDQIAAARAQEKKDGLSQGQFLERLFSLSQEGRLGADLASLCKNRNLADTQSFDRLADSIEDRMASLPLVLTNVELDVGIHPDTGERRCFDVHSTCLQPQFQDLRQALGRPDEVDDGWGPGWPDRQHWALTYTNAFNASATEQISVEDVLAGARIHWIHHALDPNWKNWFINRVLSGEEGCALNIYSVMRWLFDHIDGKYDD